MGALSSVDEVITIPTKICHRGSHACFGYRVLEESFKNLSETLQLVTDLCGKEDPQVPCPALSLPPSPNQDYTPLPPIHALSPSPEHSPIITAGDYMTDEQITEFMLKLQQKEERRSIPSGLSVICSYLTLFPH
jgi:hypothetical protein